jgi:hypothetical protein
MADDRERDAQGRFVSRKRGQPDEEVESYDGVNPATPFAEGPAPYNLIQQIISTFGLHPGWQYVDIGITDQRPADPKYKVPQLSPLLPRWEEDLHPEWHKRVGMGVEIAVVDKILRYLSTTRAVNHAWRDIVDRTLEYPNFALLVKDVSHPVSLKECLLNWRHWVPGLHLDVNKEHDAGVMSDILTGHSGSWSRDHGGIIPAYDPKDPMGAAQNKDRYDKLTTLSKIEGDLLTEKTSSGHLTPATVRTAVLGPPLEAGEEWTDHGKMLYGTAYKLLDDDVFLREYLGLSEADMFELNHDAREIAPKDVPERTTKDAPYGMERDVEAELRAKYAVGGTGNVKPIYKPKGPPTAAPPGPPRLDAVRRDVVRKWLRERNDKYNRPTTTRDVAHDLGFDNVPALTRLQCLQLESCYTTLEDDKELRTRCNVSDEEMTIMNRAVRSLGPEFAARISQHDFGNPTPQPASLPP